MTLKLMKSPIEDFFATDINRSLPFSEIKNQANSHRDSFRSRISTTNGCIPFFTIQPC